MDRLVRIFKGKGKAPEVVEVKRKSRDLLSRVHLVKDPERAWICSYHLHPLMPALYILGDQGPYTRLIKTPELIQVGSAIPWGSYPVRRAAARNIARDVMVDLYDTRIIVRLVNSSNRIWANWSMQVSESEGGDVEDFPAPGKAEEAAASVPDPEDYHDAPPPYSATAPESGPSNISEFVMKPEMPASSSMTQSMPHFASPPAFEPICPSFTTALRNTGSLSSISDKEEIKISDTEAAFAWEQVSSRARLKLMHPKSRVIYAEYIQETNANKIADGIQGQLLFRRSFGHEWQMAVLLTLGMSAEMGKYKVWEDEA